jgi:hypothetical protein
MWLWVVLANRRRRSAVQDRLRLTLGSSFKQDPSSLGIASCMCTCIVYSRLQVVYLLANIHSGPDRTSASVPGYAVTPYAGRR